MALKYWLRHPTRLIARLRYWSWQRRNPDAPWLCPGTVRFLDSALDSSMVALEFGSGRSTAWFGSRVGRLTSVEYDEGWFHKVRRELEQRGGEQVDLRYIPLDHSHSEGERESYDPVPAYVAVLDEFADASLNLIVVDGHYRTNCVRHSLARLAPGGYLLVDDTQQWASRDALGIPHDWILADLSSNGLKDTSVFQKPG